MTIENWLTLAGILAGAGVGYFVKFLLDKRTQFVTKNAEIKRGAYLELCELMLDLFSQDKIGKMSTKSMLTRLNSFYSKYILYASPSVIVSFGELMQYIYQHAERLDASITMRKMTHVFMEMRKDIGLSNKNLGSDAERILRARFTDYDELFESQAEQKVEVDLTDTSDKESTDTVKVEMALNLSKPATTNSSKNNKKKRKKK